MKQYSAIQNIARLISQNMEGSELCSVEKIKVEQLMDKMNRDDITVSVIGQFKRGKSTTVNAMLGQEILPVGIVPVTSAVTIIKYGEKEAKVRFENGMIKSIPVEELSDYINEQKNPDNKLQVASVTMKAESEFLKNNLTLVDTPGVGSIHKHNSEAAYSFVKESDAVIFMLSVDSPINEIEIDFLSNAKEHAAKFYFAVNKVDLLDEKDLAEYMNYCSNLICGLMGVEEVNLFPVSGRNGTGIEELKKAILDDCKDKIKEILALSVRMKLYDIIGGVFAKLRLYSEALQLSTSRLNYKFRLMREEVEQIKKDGESIVKHLPPIDDNDKNSIVQLEKNFNLHINSFKQRLTEKISEIFGIDYDYSIMDIDVSDENVIEEGSKRTSALTVEELSKEFLQDLDDVCEELEGTLNLILMYRESNTITVARRLNDMNRLYRRLRSFKSMLQNVEIDG